MSHRKNPPRGLPTVFQASHPDAPRCACCRAPRESVSSVGLATGGEDMWAPVSCWSSSRRNRLKASSTTAICPICCVSRRISRRTEAGNPCIRRPLQVTSRKEALPECAPLLTSMLHLLPKPLELLDHLLPDLWLLIRQKHAAPGESVHVQGDCCSTDFLQLELVLEQFLGQDVLQDNLGVVHRHAAELLLRREALDVEAYLLLSWTGDISPIRRICCNRSPLRLFSSAAAWKRRHSSMSLRKALARHS